MSKIVQKSTIYNEKSSNAIYSINNSFSHYLKKVYSFKMIRYPIKVFVTFAIIKVVWEGLQYVTYSSEIIKYPRSTQLESYQNPLNPPLYQPYPFTQNYQDLQNSKQYINTYRNLYEIFVFKANQRVQLYNDHPERQNIHAVDHYYQYAKYLKRDSFTKIAVLKKIKAEGGNIPEGINQKIRQLEQYTLDNIKPITPVL